MKEPKLNYKELLFVLIKTRSKKQKLGDKASVISNHSGMDVLKKHHVNDQRLVASARGFSVFKD